MSVEQIVSVGSKPSRKIDGANNGTPGSALPTATTLMTIGTAMGFGRAKEIAHGVGSRFGLTTIKISGACVVSLYVYDEADNTWCTGGATTGRYQLAFAAKGQDEFKIPPDQLFYLVSDTGSISCTTAARPVSDLYPRG